METEQSNVNPDQESAPVKESPQPLEAVPWRQYIPSDLKDKQYWERYPDDLGQVLKIHADAQREVDSRIPLPTKPDDPKWNDVYKALGRPESADEYKYDLPQLDGVEWDESALNGFKEAAHKLGFSKQQYEGVLDVYSNQLKSQWTELQQRHIHQTAEVEVGLKTEWGPNYKLNLELARKAGEHLFGEDGKAFVERAYGNNSNVIKGLAKLGRELNDDGLFGGDVGQRLGGVSPDEAQAEMKSILGDPTNRMNEAYWSRSASQAHTDAVNRVQELSKVIAQSRQSS